MHEDEWDWSTVARGFSEKNAEESCPEKHEGYGHEGGNGAGPLCLLGGILLGMQILYIRQHLAKTIFSVRHVFCHFVAMLVIFDAHIGIIHRKTGFFMLCKNWSDFVLSKNVI